jgi:hypothetical protein
MSNRIDFFQSQCDALSTSAATASVYLDGQWCDFLVPQKIMLAADADFSQAILNYHPKDNDIMPEEIDSVVRCGQKIAIKMVYDEGIGKTIPNEIPVFAGFVEQINTNISSNQQEITVVAKDSSARLRKKTVYGETVSEQGQGVFIAAAETVFNPAGKPNASKQDIAQNGRSFRAFAVDENDAVFFTCADAIYYLLCSYIPPGEIVIPTLEELGSLTCERSIIDIDVTGLNLIDALRRCCGQAGIRFKFVPSMGLTGPEEAIVFFRPQNSAQVELNCQWPGEKLDISKTSIAEITGKKNFSPITHRYIVQGDYKIYEATFELIKAWDPALEENNYERYSPVTNENFNQVRDVYRKWCLNEAGDYSVSPYNQGPAFDFSKIFENGSYIRKKRRFQPTLTSGQDGSSVGYYLEVSYTNGSHWWPYMASFKILLDQCGVLLSAEQLDMDMWFAILKGVLKFRITACVVADERINFSVADGPVNSTIEVIDKIITLPRRFRYKKVSPSSIFVNNSADQADDTNSLVEFARTMADSSQSETERLNIKTLLLMPFLSPGDRITTSLDSRDILKIKYDNRSYCWLESIDIDFENQQTILTAVKTRK